MSFFRDLPLITLSLESNESQQEKAEPNRVSRADRTFRKTDVAFLLRCMLKQ